MPERQLTVLFMPESAYGPTNNCIGIADLLRRKGHRVVFAAEASWKGKLSALGFEEMLVDLAPPAQETQEDQEPGAFWKQFIKDTAPEFRKNTIDQLETLTRPIWEELINGAKYCEPQLKRIIAEADPDVIVEDNVLTFPALVTAGKPFVRIVSCNPLEVPGENVPPVFSGYGFKEKNRWQKFRDEYRRTHGELWREFNDWVQEQGAEPLDDLEFSHRGTLNLYVYPEELDYLPDRPLDDTWHRLDSSVRRTDDAVELPEHIEHGNGALIYFSLGSLGSADVELMRRVIDALARTPHRYIVSKGPLADEIELAPNMWGAEFLPQTALLPKADLVITHGGNNTTTEAMHAGVPLIVLPLFWDQYDNAQRVHECGFGVRLDPYRFTHEEMHAAIGHLLSDRGVRARVEAAGARIRGARGLERAADLIESVVDQGRRRAPTDLRAGGAGGLRRPRQGTQVGLGQHVQRDV